MRMVARNGGVARWLLAVGMVVAGPVAVDRGAAGVDTRGAAVRPPLYGFTWQGSLAVVRVDRWTLRPRSGPRVPLDGLNGEPLGWSFAPDRSRLALGSTERGAKLRLIDLVRMRGLGGVRIAPRGSLVATAWPSARRLLAVVVTPGCCGAGDTVVAGVSVGSRRVLWKRRLGGSLQAGQRVGRRLLLVLGPRERSVGPSRLVEVGAGGRIRSVALPEIQSGIEPAAPTRAGDPLTRSWNPGLAVDRPGARAFVVQAAAPVAEVELSAFRVRSHALGPRAQTADDALVGPTRQAIWLGQERLAVTGVDEHLGGPQPAGLTLIDTRRWLARTIDTRATDVALVSGTLLASSFLPRDRGKISGSGLTGYTIDGQRTFHRYGEEPIFGAEPVGRRALIGTPKGTLLITARTGRQIRSYGQFSMTLLTRDQPIY